MHRLTFRDPIAPPKSLFNEVKLERYPKCGCKVVRELSKEPLLHSSDSSLSSDEEERSREDPVEEAEAEDKKPEKRPHIPANICGLRYILEQFAPLMCSNHRKLAILECYSPTIPTWLQQIRALELSEEQVYDTVYALHRERAGLAVAPKAERRQDDHDYEGSSDSSSSSDSCDDQEKVLREVLKKAREDAASPARLEAAIRGVFNPPLKKNNKKTVAEKCLAKRTRASSGRKPTETIEVFSSDEEQQRKQQQQQPIKVKNEDKNFRRCGLGLSPGGLPIAPPRLRKQPYVPAAIRIQIANAQMAPPPQSAGGHPKTIVVPEAKESTDQNPDSGENQPKPIEPKGPGKRVATVTFAKDSGADAGDAGDAGAGPGPCPKKARPKSKAGGRRRRRKKSACRKSKKSRK